MLGVDPEFGASVLRLWVAAGSAALLVLFCALAFFQSQLQMAASPLRRAGFVIVGAVLGAALTWTLVAHSSSADRGDERRAFEQRADELSARALAPGSPLACLDALVGDSLKAACEKVLFASPANVAAASAYVAARLALLSSMTAYVAQDGANIDDVLLPLRRSLEADRFGFLAQVLAVRDGCTSQNCKALAVLHDASRVRANLSAQTLAQYLEHYAALWAAAPDGVLADATRPSSMAAQPNAPGPRRIVNIDFPTAASIPPISIMNPEPGGPVLPGVAAAAAANPNPPSTTSSRRRRQTSNPQALSQVQSESTGSTATEPIWPEPVPPPPPSTSRQTAVAPAAAAPIQLGPPVIAPGRTQ